MNNEMIYLHQTTAEYQSWSRSYKYVPVKDGKVINHSKLLAIDLLERCYLQHNFAMVEDVTEKELSLKRSANKYLLVIGNKVFCVKNAKGKPMPKWFSSKSAALEYFKDNILVGDFLKHWGVDGKFYKGNTSGSWIIPKEPLVNDLITSDFVEVFKNEK